MHVDNEYTEHVKADISTQFLDLAQVFRLKMHWEEMRSETFQAIAKNVWRYSPKMRCWLYREIFDEMHLIQEAGQMAKPKDVNPTAEADLVKWGFVNVTLSDDEREAAEQEYSDSGVVWDELVTNIKDGYKATLSYDVETDSFCAALSGTSCGKPNERFTLTAWAGDEMTALAYLMYKHKTKLGFVWNNSAAKQKRLG